MKVMLIQPSYKEDNVLPPLGLAYIAAILQREGCKVSIYDMVGLGAGIDDVRQEFAKEKPDLVGISCLSAVAHIAHQVASASKELLPESKVVMGGPHVSALPEHTLKEHEAVDYVVVGEGEYTVLELVRSLEEGRKLDGVRGLVFRHNGHIVNNGRRPYIDNLDELPFPARHLLPMERYKPPPEYGVRVPFTTMLTSRGCPYQCAFCASYVTFGQRFKFRSPDNVVDEIEHLRDRFKVREVWFVDDEFTLNRERVIRICKEILARDADIVWTCSSRVDAVDDEMLSWMRRAGCYLISYGVESGSQKIIDIIGKRITLEQAKRAIELTRRHGVTSSAFFIIGNPGDTHDTVRQTIDYAKSLDPNYAFFSMSTPFPGTKLYEMARTGMGIKFSPSGFSQLSRYAYGFQRESGHKPVVETDELGEDDLTHYMKLAYKSFYLRPRFILKSILRIRTRNTLKQSLKGFYTLLRWYVK